MRVLTIASVSLYGLASCSSGGGGGGGEPAPEPNDPPALSVPSQLGGGPVQFSFVLPIGGSETLTFTATDPDEDALTWQLAASAAGQLATGMSYSSPASGPSFSIELAAVSAPAAVSVSLLVEDPNGGAAAVDVQIVRSGAPLITGVSPSSAFVSAPQRATVTGSALLLDNAVNTAVTFGAAAAGDVVAVDDATITCTTPAPGLLGANNVAVQNAFGSDSLPASAFTMYAYPVDLLDSDVGLDGGAGRELAAANDGAVLHVVWIEGGAVQHQRSLDGGATWLLPTPLSGGEAPGDLTISVLGDEVLVVWIGDGTEVYARASVDGGQSFGAASVVNVAASAQPCSRLQVARAGSRVYCAWLQGAPALSQQRVWAAASPNNGGVWQAEVSVSDQGVNQAGHVLGCDEEAAWIAFEAAPPAGAGVYTSRSTDGGILWTAGVLRSAISSGIDELAVCDDGGRVNLVWTRDGQLEYLISENSALGWQTQPTVFRPADLGAITDIQVRCSGDRLFAAYVAGGLTVACSRVGAAGALPEHVTLSDVSESASAPDLAVSGDYLFATWRGGDVSGGTGSARVKLATSVDVGATFASPTTFGDGASAQDLPLLVVDGARVWIGWLDYRGATAALFANRTEG